MGKKYDFIFQKGFSIVEITIGLALAAGLGLVLMRQTENSSKMQVKNNSNQVVNSAVNSIQTSLANQAICTKSLEGYGVGDQIPALVNAKIDPSDYSNIIVDGTNIVDTTTIFPGDVKVENMQIIAHNECDPNSAPCFHDYLLVNFNLDPRDRKKQFSAKIIGKRFRLQGLKNSAEKYISCYSEVSNLLETAMIKACESLGGVFNPLTQKCEISDLIRRSDLVQLWKTNTGLLTPVQPSPTENGEVTCQKSDKRCSRTNLDCNLPSCPPGHVQGPPWEWDRQQSALDKACMKSAKCMYISVPSGFMVKPP